MNNKKLDERLIQVETQTATGRLTSRQVRHETNSYLPVVAALLENNPESPFPLRLSLLDTSYRLREISLPIELT
jgi:hypothetical protein